MVDFIALLGGEIMIFVSAADLQFSTWCSLQVKDILKPEVMDVIIMLTQQRLLEQEG